MKPIFVGNWKMHKTKREVEDFCLRFASLLKEKSPENCEFGIAPSYLGIETARTALAGSGVLVGGQNAHWREEGAHTGEVAPGMLVDCDADFVILGHSERRQYYGENDEAVSLRAKACIKSGLRTIICVGESEEDYKAKNSKKIVEEQINGSLFGLTEEDAKQITIAYEPVWAIGTGLAATPELAGSMHDFIRELLTKLWPSSVADEIAIQYGGSTKPDNVAELCAQKNINGALVGGASLDPDIFYALIINATS